MLCIGIWCYVLLCIGIWYFMLLYGVIWFFMVLYGVVCWFFMVLLCYEKEGGVRKGGGEGGLSGYEGVLCV